MCLIVEFCTFFGVAVSLLSLWVSRLILLRFDALIAQSREYKKIHDPKSEVRIIRGWWYYEEQCIYRFLAMCDYKLN